MDDFMLSSIEPYDNEYSFKCVVEAKKLINGIVERVNALICICEDLNIACNDLDKAREELFDIANKLFQSILEEADEELGEDFNEI